MKKTYISSLVIAMVAGSTAVLAQSGTSVVNAGPAAGGEQMLSTEQIFRMGVELFNAEKYEDAKMAFKEVLEGDPYNTAAMDYLSRIYAKVNSIDRLKRDLTRLEQMSEIQDNWALDDTTRLTNLTPDDTEEIDTAADAAKQKMIKRLEETMIAAVEFNGNLSIQDAVIYLTEVCRRDGQNVNMVVLGLQGSDSMDAGYEGNNISLTVENVNLYKVLGIITEMADLRFEVDADTVYIMPYDYERPIDMEDATIKVSKEVGLKLAEYAAPSDDAEVDEVDNIFDLGGGGGSVDLPSGPVDLTDYIKSLNINSPRHSVATYTPDSSEVTVRNTPANIKKIKNRLNAIQQQLYFEAEQQVKIEAKFVEFSEGALKEVGLDWLVRGTGSVGGFELSDSANHVFGQTYVNKTTPGGKSYAGTNPYTEGVFTGGTRTSTDAMEAVTSGILSSMGNGGILPAMIFDRGDVAAKLSMLEQEGTADVLSCPSVTTVNGELATIRVVEIHRFPQDYDVETGQRTAPIVSPQDWEDFDLGVVLSVTPEIKENGTITMELEPKIVKFKGFDQYAVAVNSYVAEGEGASSGTGETLYAQMPYFEIRSVSTKVTVADSHTVVMGGLIDERTETYRDQVPILGDIPYFGKLFRHEGARTEKKNLVIYIKPTQVDVRGLTLAESERALQASR
ncbi:MAG: hypothetical protein JXR23_02730 [Pontiellaceae bacterium]|nr:hypothetical protein [Pontiellaceae bacterium]